MSEEENTEGVTEEEDKTVLERVEDVVDDVKEKLEDGKEILKKVDEVGDAIAPVAEAVAPVVEGLANAIVPGAGAALGAIREGAQRVVKPAVKGLLGAVADDAWISPEEEEGGWIRVASECNEKLNMVILTSSLPVQGGFLYRVLTSKADGTGVPVVVLSFVPS